MYHYHIRYTIHSEYDIHIDILNIHMLLLVILTVRVTRLTLQLIHVNIRDQSRTILRYILNPEAICLLIR